MRIRRRGSLSQAPDLSLHLQAPANGRQEADDKPGGEAPGLHPDVDLPVDPHHGCTNKAISSSPSNPASQLSVCCIPSLDPSLVKELGEKQQQVLEEKVDVFSNKLSCVAQLAQVNSNKREERKAKTKATTTSVKDEDRVLLHGSTVKKRKSPAVLMEGSRCSRVNGRGWRCCQQTLVGYSLCEHHLGKGRLKTMTSVRGQLGSTRPIKPASSGDQAEINGFKKSKKIGMVKARSINSLLGDKNKNHSLALPTTAAAATTTSSDHKAATA
ncbi:hypothetical protein J5N97_005672 [Dioscorea zingiberensis]|uniref:WRC domain-containing protein n=1 Tax=Dioscorea zingiberensis TaxID=325984 RepID=A0A9D5HSX0_9LILI|nr:hypothetical protein J5N97_005672 [Dioscorea zingiberensis]